MQQEPSQQQIIIVNPQSKPPYWLGLLCLIPLLGAFVGLGILLSGIFKYKDKWFIATGVFGILFTVVIYGSLFYFSRTQLGRRGFATLSQWELNRLVRSIEFYNLEHGQYPDSLQQLKKEDSSISISDVASPSDSRSSANYNYHKIGNRYTVYSSGLDGISNTKDDFYPDIIITDSSKIGFVRAH